MADALPPSSVPSLARAREAKITELSAFFANDDLTLEDLERRIEHVYKASSVVELETITADLRSAAAPPVDYARAAVPTRPGKRDAAVPGSPPRGVVTAAAARILSIMSSTRRVGAWVVPQKLDVVGIMSDSRIDLTHAVLPPGIIEIDLRLLMTSFKLVVPANVRVVNEAHSIMASVQSRESDASARASDSESVVRLTGFAVMADVKIVVRRSDLDDWDD